MRPTLSKSIAFGLLGMMVLAASPTGAAPASIDGAQGAPEGASTPVAYSQTYRQLRRRAAPGAAQGGQYFVEFRSRYALSYGHTFAAFGRLDARGKISSFEVAGLHPAGESSVPWMVGHLVPVPAETGPSDGDLDPRYISNSYRVTMNEAEYVKVVAKIRDMQRSTPLWSATVYNCNSFVGDIARFMGLSSFTSTLQVPPAYIASLKAINNGQSSIAPGSI